MKPDYLLVFVKRQSFEHKCFHRHILLLARRLRLYNLFVVVFFLSKNRNFDNISILSYRTPNTVLFNKSLPPPARPTGAAVQPSFFLNHDIAQPTDNPDNVAGRYCVQLSCLPSGYVFRQRHMTPTEFCIAELPETRPHLSWSAAVISGRIVSAGFILLQHIWSTVS